MIYYDQHTTNLSRTPSNLSQKKNIGEKTLQEEIHAYALKVIAQNIRKTIVFTNEKKKYEKFLEDICRFA